MEEKKKEHHITHHEHKEHHATMHVKKKKPNYWFYATLILAVLLIIAVSTDWLKLSQGGDIKTISENTVKYINDNLLQGQTATLKSYEEKNGLYSIKMEIGGREFDSYITKDGELLFPQIINLTEKIETPEQEPQKPLEYPKTDTPNVKMFVMSFCPYGQQAESGLKPAAELLGSKISFEPHFVVYANYRGGGPDYCLDNESKYCSMHGINELKEDVRQLCIWKYNKAKFWSYVDAINSKCSVQNIESCWEGVAKENGIDVAKIKACQKDEALTLLKAEAELNTKYDVQGSPTIIINDQEYSGGRSGESFKQGICSAFTTQPAECSKSLGTAEATAAGGCAT